MSCIVLLPCSNNRHNSLNPAPCSLAVVTTVDHYEKTQVLFYWKSIYGMDEKYVLCGGKL